MFFLVCFHCVEVFTRKEGHCCPFSEGNESERNSADVILIRAEPVDLKKDSPASTKVVNCIADSKNSRRTRGDLKFSVVEETDGQTTNMGCRTTNNNVCDGDEATRNKNVDKFNPLASDLRKDLAVSYTPPAFPGNVADYLRQSTQSESNKFTSTTNKCIVKYPKESQQTSQSSRQSACNEYNMYASTQDANIERHTTYNYVCDNEISRIENIENVHPLEPNPRHAIPLSHIPQLFPEKIFQHSHHYTQPEISKNAFSVVTHMAGPLVFFHQAAQSFRQSAWTEYNKYASTQDANIECHTTYNYVYGNDEISRTENFENFHPIEPDQRNAIPLSHIPQLFPEKIVQHSRHYTQHEISKKAFSVSTQIVEPPAFFHQVAHSSRQSAWNECSKYSSTQGAHTEEFRAVPNVSEPSSRLQKVLKDCTNNSVKGAQVIESWLHRKTRKVFTCEKCGSCFKLRNKFNVHLQSNCDPNPYKCYECGHNFPTKTKLSAHSQCHKEKNFKCYICSYASQFKSNLKIHMKGYHELKKYKFQIP